MAASALLLDSPVWSSVASDAVYFACFTVGLLAIVTGCVIAQIVKGDHDSTASRHAAEHRMAH
ncbi:MAG TPA: hypothetical protein VGL53_27275 [Bryobacteraceae bacterium]|jgi:hypothetical protein